MLLLTTMTPTERRFFCGLLVFAVVMTVAFFLPPLAQPQIYHGFADRRAWLKVPNFLDVASNGFFFLVALLGLATLHRPGPGAFTEAQGRLPWAVFFLGLAAIGFGSTWYHLAPNNANLFWDRLPMSLCFSALLAALVADRVSVRAGLLALAPLIVIGTGTVLYWRYSQALGAENVLPYFVFQAAAFVFGVFLMRFFPPVYTGGEYLARTAAWYGAALFAEFFDRAIFAIGQVLSGHTVKHMLAALAVYQLVQMLQVRRPLA